MSCQVESSSVDAAIKGRFHGIHFYKFDDDMEPGRLRNVYLR